MKTILKPLLRKGKQWAIEFYVADPKKGILRIRRSFKLNYIKSYHERLEKAQEILTWLPDRLVNKFPYILPPPPRPEKLNFLGAVEKSLKSKCSTDRENTIKTYRSVISIFIRWVYRQKLDKIQPNDFTRHYAFDFLDYIATRNLKNRTYNNYLMVLKIIFNDMKERDLIAHNPWQKFKKKKEEGKSRKIIPDELKKPIFDYILQKERLFALAVILTYHCFIRPAELRRLKFGMFNLREGVIDLPGEVTKNRDQSIVTIPKDIIPFFRGFGLESKPANYFVFGEGFEMGSKTQCLPDAFNKRNKKIIDEMISLKLIPPLPGVTFYSWKDTGVSTLIKQNVDIYQIMRQLRHSELSMTQKYIQSISNINQSIRNLESDIIYTQIPPGFAS